jgi:coenzyme PQQ precursor peptide PqqA
MRALSQTQLSGADDMQWETPSFEDIRFGFEVTMYINNR